MLHCLQFHTSSDDFAYEGNETCAWCCSAYHGSEYPTSIAWYWLYVTFIWTISLFHIYFIVCWNYIWDINALYITISRSISVQKTRTSFKDRGGPIGEHWVPDKLTVTSVKCPGILNSFMAYISILSPLLVWLRSCKWGLVMLPCTINSSPPGQNGRHFASDIFKRIFLNEDFGISIWISLKFVPKGPIGSKSALIPVMAWRRTGDKSIHEPMLTQFTVAYMRH